MCTVRQRASKETEGVSELSDYVICRRELANEFNVTKK